MPIKPLFSLANLKRLSTRTGSTLIVRLASAFRKPKGYLYVSKNPETFEFLRLALSSKRKEIETKGSAGDLSELKPTIRLKGLFERIRTRLVTLKVKRKKQLFPLQEKWLRDRYRKIRWIIEEALTQRRYPPHLQDSLQIGEGWRLYASRPSVLSTPLSSTGGDARKALGQRSPRIKGSNSLFGSPAKPRRACSPRSREARHVYEILESAEAIISTERRDSLSKALLPIINDCRAHYNLIKRKEDLEPSCCVADYWVAWGLVFSVANAVTFDRKVVKYASKDFRIRANEFVKLADSLHLFENHVGRNMESQRNERTGKSTGISTGFNRHCLSSS